MRKIISILLLLAMLFTTAFTLIACGVVPPDNDDNDDSDDNDDKPNQDRPNENLVQLNSDFVVIYNSFILEEKTLVEDFIDEFKTKYGIKLTKEPFSKESEYEIQIGTLSSRDEYKEAKTKIDRYSNENFGVATIKATEKSLMIFGSTTDAIKVAIEHALESIITSNAKYDKTTDELIIFDAVKYKKNGELVGYTLDDLSKFSDATSIQINNQKITEFSPEVTEYSYETDYKQGYPSISVTPLSREASVSYQEPTEANGGIATVTITSGNGENVTVYRIKVNMKATYDVSSQIVNKDGKKAMVTYVIDDGIQDPTANIAKELLNKYSNLNLTFAVTVKDFAYLTTKQSGDKLVYVMDNGRYTYTRNTTQINNYNYWKNILDMGRTEITSHSYTHLFHGINDDGGIFQYVSNKSQTIGGVTELPVIISTQSFPVGSSTKEVYAAKQVLEDLFGIESLTLVHPGISVMTSDYTLPVAQKIYTDVKTDGIYKTTTGTTLPAGTVMKTYKTFFDNVVRTAIEAGDLIGTRDTFSPSKPLSSYVNTPKISWDRRVSGVYAYMVDWNESDKSLWTKYIDAAIDMGGWACFCLHNIRTDDPRSGHYISKTEADGLFKYTYDLRDDVAVVNFTEATKYYHEWNSAEVKSVAYKDESVSVSITDGLNNSLYNVPLTVKVEVPSNWESATYSYNGSTGNLSISKDSDNKCYVYVDVIPDIGEAVIVGVK